MPQVRILRAGYDNLTTASPRVDLLREWDCCARLAAKRLERYHATLLLSAHEGNPLSSQSPRCWRCPLVHTSDCTQTGRSVGFCRRTSYFYDRCRHGLRLVLRSASGLTAALQPLVCLQVHNIPSLNPLQLFRSPFQQQQQQQNRLGPRPEQRGPIPKVPSLLFELEVTHTLTPVKSAWRTYRRKRVVLSLLGASDIGQPLPFFGAGLLCLGPVPVSRRLLSTSA